MAPKRSQEKRSKEELQRQKEDKFWAGLSDELHAQHDQLQQASASSRMLVATRALGEAEETKKAAKLAEERASDLQAQAMAWAKTEEERLRAQFAEQQRWVTAQQQQIDKRTASLAASSIDGRVAVSELAEERRKREEIEERLKGATARMREMELEALEALEKKHDTAAEEEATAAEEEGTEGQATRRPSKRKRGHRGG